MKIFSNIENFYLIDAVFQAKQQIRSLARWHAARWSAWLHYACAGLGARLNDILSGLLPLRNGQQQIYQGEIITLRLLIGDKGLPWLAGLAHSLMSHDVHGEFSSSSLELLFWRDATGDIAYPPYSPPFAPLPFNQAILVGEIQYLSKLTVWSLHFFVPLRLKLPEGEKRLDRGAGYYCPAPFFSSPHALNYLCSMVCFIPSCDKPEGSVPQLAHTQMNCSGRICVTANPGKSLWAVLLEKLHIIHLLLRRLPLFLLPVSIWALAKIPFLAWVTGKHLNLMA